MSLSGNLKIHGNKERSQSEVPPFTGGPITSAGMTSPSRGEGLRVDSVDVYNWKLKKGKDDVVYASYGLHVILRNGIKWIVEKRYSQFRDLRREIKLTRPELASIEFPKKKWFFNLSKSAITDRQVVLNAYLRGVIAADPQPLELAIFFEVDAHVNNNGSSAFAPMQRSMSFASLATASLSINDFHLIKVLGKGR